MLSSGETRINARYGSKKIRCLSICLHTTTLSESPKQGTTDASYVRPRPQAPSNSLFCVPDWQVELLPSPPLFSLALTLSSPFEVL